MVTLYSIDRDVILNYPRNTRITPAGSGQETCTNSLIHHHQADDDDPSLPALYFLDGWTCT